MIQKTTRPTTSLHASRKQQPRNSLSSSAVFTNSNKYPFCVHDKKHNKEIMNLICLSENCENKGLICALCKNNQHLNHIVMPVIKFIEKMEVFIKDKANKDNELGASSVILGEQKQEIVKEPGIKIEEEQKKQNQGVQMYIEEVNKCRNQMLYALSTLVKKLSEQFMKIQEKIIKETQKVIEKIQSSQDVLNTFSKIINSIKEENNSDEMLFKQKIDTLSEFVVFKSKDSFSMKSDNFNKNLKQISQMNVNFTENVQRWHQNHSKIFSTLFEVPAVLKEQPKQKSASTNPKFSSELKSKGIQILNQGKIAKSNDKLAMVLISGQNTKQKSAKIKILNMVSAIYLGVCIKDIVKSISYKPNFMALGHGTFLNGSNSMLFSHSGKISNGSPKGITFGQGQQIQVSIKGDTVIFTKKSDGKSASLKMNKMNETELKQLCICAFFEGPENKIQLVQ